MAPSDLAPMHILADSLESLIVEFQQKVERVAGLMGVAEATPCEEPAASGATLQSRLVRSIQTVGFALTTLTKMEVQLDFEGGQPAPTRGMSEPDFRS